MQAVGDMGDRSGKGEWQPRQKQKDEKETIENSRIGWCRIYGQYFSVASFSRSGRRRSQGVAVSGFTGRLVGGVALSGKSTSAVLRVE